MKISVICFTRDGYRQLSTLYEAFLDSDNFPEILPFCKCSALENICSPDITYVKISTAAWAGQQMENGSALLFIGATGIAVRSIAPHVQSKLSDSPVLVMDDKARFIIPLLSGHVGGANELALFLADFFGSVPVITTATDTHEKFAIDMFAKEHNLSIINKEGIARVSAKVLENKSIRIGVVGGREHLTQETVRKIAEKYGKQVRIEEINLTDQGPGSEEPVGEELSSAELMREEFAVTEPVSAELMREEAAGTEPAGEEPAQEESAGTEPAQEESVGTEPAQEESVGIESAQFVSEFFDALILPENMLSKFTCLKTDSFRPQPLYLSPREYVIGMGCKKGKAEEDLLSFANEVISEAGLGWNQIYAIASADRKKDEPGLNLLAEKKRLPFLTFSSEELNAVSGEFHESDFVRSQIGVGNVCERAAIKACGENGALIVPKRAENGMTIAIAKRFWKI